jgi:hypothetical protein
MLSVFAVFHFLFGFNHKLGIPKLSVCQERNKLLRTGPIAVVYHDRSHSCDLEHDDL